LWEFGCGPGSEKHELGWKPGDQRPVHRFLRVAGGFLSGELRYDDGDRSAGTLVLQHRTVEGDVVSEFRFPIEPADAR
jgi:alkaline phosphatase D